MPITATDIACCTITVGEIIKDVCIRCGIPEDRIDVSELIDEVIHVVDGYAVGRPTTGRGMIQPLYIHTPFDCVESDGILKFTARGNSDVATIEADDLAAHASGEARPPAVEVMRQQEVELPKRVRLHYAQANQNYELGEQSSSRVSVSTLVETDVEAPMAMTETKAAQAANVALYEAWVARNRYRIALGTKFMRLEAGDAITIPVDGIQTRVRVTNIDHVLPTLLRMDCVADDIEGWQSYAIGSETIYGGPAEMEMDNAGTARFVVLDIPIVRSTEVDAGYYVAVCSIGSTFFSGSSVYRAPDLVTFDEVASTEFEATMGVLDFDLPAGPTTVWDEANEIIVTLDAGELESFPEASVLLGKNSAAVGADGRWEIIQFRDAELIVSSPQTNTWRLTGLLRGRRGTEWAVGTAVAGDDFVLLDEAVMRVPLEYHRIGGEVAHKALLFGGPSLADSDAENFTPMGVPLMPFSPIDLSVIDDGGDLELTWVRRSRAGTELLSGMEIPLLETSEAYEIDILASADPATVIRTITATTPAATYTAAEQTADWGGPTPELLIRVYQMSAVVGRGYVLEGTY